MEKVSAQKPLLNLNHVYDLPVKDKAGSTAIILSLYL